MKLDEVMTLLSHVESHTVSWMPPTNERAVLLTEIVKLRGGVHGMVQVLRELQPLIKEVERDLNAPCYGNFHGGDPRNFHPDPECSTEAEREAHRKACEAWERGERPETIGGCIECAEGETVDIAIEGGATTVTVIDGKPVRKQVQPFGLGTYTTITEEEEGILRRYFAIL